MKAFFLITGIVLLALVLFSGEHLGRSGSMTSAIGAFGLVIGSSLAFVASAIIEAGSPNPGLKMQAALFLLGMALIVLAVVYFYHPRGGLFPIVLAIPGGSLFIGSAVIEVAIQRRRD